LRGSSPQANGGAKNTALAQPQDEDIVCAAWKHAEVYRQRKDWHDVANHVEQDKSKYIYGIY